MILRRYLYREVLQSFGAVIVILALIFVSHRFVRFVAEAAAGKLSADLIARLLALKLASSFVVLIPISVFVAVLLALGRLYKDSEVTAMLAGGFGITSITRNLTGLLAGFCGFTLLMSLYIAPEAHELMEQTRAWARERSDITGVFAGRFKQLGGGQDVIYGESMPEDRRSMEKIFVQRGSSDQQEIILAARARQVGAPGLGSRYVVLEDGHRYRGSPGEADYVVTRFRTHAVRIDDAIPELKARKLEGVATLELWRSGTPSHLAELQWRVSHGIAVVVLGVLAVALARTTPREGRYGKLFTGIVLYFVYSNFLGVAQRMMETGELPPAVGVWPVHLVMASLAVWLLRLQVRQRPSKFARQRIPRPVPRPVPKAPA